MTADIVTGVSRGRQSNQCRDVEALGHLILSQSIVGDNLLLVTLIIFKIELGSFTFYNYF